ncbi:MAG: hypothetical protein BGO95_11545 [Micrococcales bacterium 73-13]|nr:MAG: hypothetical protein BGO95_11545 [Micrococcales bacterium 73-13]
MLVITGASGQLGRAVAAEVAARRGGEGLVLATRSPAAVADAIPGAEARRADFGDPASLADAFAGADGVLLISTDDIADRATGQMAAIDAAKAAGVGHVWYTSMLSPEPGNPAIIAPSHWATEEHLRASGVDHTIVRAGFYADFQVYEAAASAASGEFVHNRGRGRCAYLTRADIARTLAALLVAGGRAGETLSLTGTESLDAVELAARYAEVAGRPVEPVEIGDEELLEALGGSTEGHNQYGARLTVSIGQAIRAGLLDLVTDTVRELTGSAPEPLEAVLARHAAAIRQRG